MYRTSFNHLKTNYSDSSLYNRKPIINFFFFSQESLRVTGILLQPIVPDLSANLLTKLNVKPSERMWSHAEELSCCNKENYEARRNLSPDNVVLFRKIKE